VGRLADLDRHVRTLAVCIFDLARAQLFAHAR
jgi:hypothetical protein